MIVRVELRRDNSSPDLWQEVEITFPSPGELGPTTEKVIKSLRPFRPDETVDGLRSEGKYAALAQANPDIWVTENV